jgi:hypothetical protein
VESFDRLRMSGDRFVLVGAVPFMLSPSKHSLGSSVLNEKIDPPLNSFAAQFLESFFDEGLFNDHLRRDGGRNEFLIFFDL